VTRPATHPGKLDSGQHRLEHTAEELRAIVEEFLPECERVLRERKKTAGVTVKLFRAAQDATVNRRGWGRCLDHATCSALGELWTELEIFTSYAREAQRKSSGITEEDVAKAEAAVRTGIAVVRFALKHTPLQTDQSRRVEGPRLFERRGDPNE
jgi:hypothetical protein